jgi:hypothetical protein
MGGLGTVAANSETVSVASGVLSGRVIQLDGSEIGSVCVEAIPVGAAAGAKIPRRDFIFTREETGAAPNFSFNALAAGSYYVEFSRTCAPNGPRARAAAVPGLFPTSYYDGSTNGTATLAEAVAVVVSPDKPATGINVQLDVAGSFNWPAALWKSPTGSIAQSSPTVGTYDGMTIAAVGSENGMVYVLECRDRQGASWLAIGYGGPVGRACRSRVQSGDRISPREERCAVDHRRLRLDLGTQLRR